MKDSKSCGAGVQSGLSKVEKFKADQSVGPATGQKTQRVTESDYGGKKVSK